MADYEQVDTFNDFTGRAVRVGDQVVYAVRASSSLWLKQGTVKKIEVHNWEVQRRDHVYPRQDWKISVSVPGGSRLSLLETPSRIVLVKTLEQMEFESVPQKVVLGNPVTMADLAKLYNFYNQARSDVMSRFQEIRGE
jgi:hypothetical protein